jgi:HlyD family secretion protein
MRWTGVLTGLAVLSISGGCSGPAAEPAMGGYAEAELVYIGPTTAGVLQALNIKRGDRVLRGQALFSLEADEQALGREGALARRDKADAQLANLRKSKRPDEVHVAEQQLLQAQAALAASESGLKRQQGLVAQAYVSPLRLEELQAARDRDAARVRELQAQLALAHQAARSDEVAAAAADARGSAADLALARWREGQRTRAAPTDAVVFDVMNRNGEFVGAGAPVVALLPPGALKLRFYVPEPDLPKAAVGREVAVSCDGCAAGLSARIRWVSPQAEFTPPVIYGASGRAKLVYLVEADPGPGSPLKPGQPLDVRFGKATPP